jgi:exodeoxyribonuclease VII small subunit
MSDADHTTPSPETPPPTETFEASLAALGEIVARLESGSLGLSESIAAYERGVGLLRRLHDELAAVEQRVSRLVRIDEEGRPVLADLEAPAADSTQSADPPADAAPDTASNPAANTAAQGSKRPRGSASRPRAARLPGMDDAGEET